MKNQIKGNQSPLYTFSKRLGLPLVLNGTSCIANLNSNMAFRASSNIVLHETIFPGCSKKSICRPPRRLRARNCISSVHLIVSGVCKSSEDAMAIRAGRRKTWPLAL